MSVDFETVLFRNQQQASEIFFAGFDRCLELASISVSFDSTAANIIDLTSRFLRPFGANGVYDVRIQWKRLQSGPRVASALTISLP